MCQDLILCSPECEKNRQEMFCCQCHAYLCRVCDLENLLSPSPECVWPTTECEFNWLKGCSVCKMEYDQSKSSVKGKVPPYYICKKCIFKCPGLPFPPSSTHGLRHSWRRQHQDESSYMLEGYLCAQHQNLLCRLCQARCQNLK